MEHVSSLALGGATDDAVWAYAKLHGYAIVSKDSDFFERSVLDVQPAKVIWIRIGNCSTDEIHALLLRQQTAIRKFLQESRESCLLLTHVN
jgi:predicted nuclease of predicted toxin-antitoxin system